MLIRFKRIDPFLKAEGPLCINLPIKPLKWYEIFEGFKNNLPRDKNHTSTLSTILQAESAPCTSSPLYGINSK
jgi:hypothetical protein